MSPIVLTAMAIAALGLWLFLRRNVNPPEQRTVPENERGGVRQTMPASASSMETADKKHMVEIAVLQAELAVSSEANAIECALRLARHSMTHESWLAGLSPQERELHNRSAAYLEAAVGPAKADPLPIGSRSKFLPHERSGDDWIDRQIEEGFRQQAVRRQRLFEATVSSLTAEPKLVPHLKEALRNLGREDLWAQIS